MLTPEDIKNILVLIAAAPIKGNEAMTVALLQQKLSAMLPQNPPKAESKQEETKKNGGKTE